MLLKGRRASDAERVIGFYSTDNYPTDLLRSRGQQMNHEPLPAQGPVDVNVRPTEVATTEHGTRYFEPEKMYQWAEEYECAMMALDKAGVPREDANGKRYSLYGRACRMRDDEHNRLRRIMDRLLNNAWDDFVKLLGRDCGA
jgi:hypothetical protein